MKRKLTTPIHISGRLEKVQSFGLDYITKLGYDKFEQPSYLKYCNGAETFYTYDNRRRLSNQRAPVFPWGFSVKYL